jgi:hypothetical protein
VEAGVSYYGDIAYITWFPYYMQAEHNSEIFYYGDIAYISSFPYYMQAEQNSGIPYYI